MIKVGQIYKEKAFRCVVTHKDDNNLYDYITRDGITICQDSAYFVKLGRKLIAEYPTWQEAVNSKEFKE